MAPRRQLRDSVIRHRVDLQSFSNHEAAASMGLLAKEDVKLIELLRKRMPNLKPGDLGASRSKALLKAVSIARKEGLLKVHGALKANLLELAKQEGRTLGRMAKAPAPLPFNAVRAAQLRQAVTATPFGGGNGAERTLGQWFGKLAVDDRTRLLGAVQGSVRRMETVDQLVRRLAGTKKLNYRDGILSISRREAETVARTAIVHVANAAQLEWNQANKDVVSGSEWVSVLDDRRCESCAELDGGFVPIDADAKPPKGMKDIGASSPPLHPRCRCTLVPVFDLDRMAGRLPDKIEVP